MTTTSNLQTSVSLPRAIEIATARVEAYAGARKTLGVSPSEAFLLDAQRAWDSALGALGSIQADARYEESVGGAVDDSLRGTPDVYLEAGDHETARTRRVGSVVRRGEKPGMRGANIGEAAFTVTGEPVQLSADDQELFDAVVVDYINFVKNEVAELVPNVEAFADAYAAGDDAKARELYAKIRVNYERIEPIAESLGVLDPRIDYREIDYLAEADQLAEDDPTFTEWLGFHRMEKDLWVPAADALQPDGTSAYDGWSPTPAADRAAIAATLQADVQKLYDTVHAPGFIDDQQIDVAMVSNGASALLEEIAVGKVTGEENWWSHYDLWDFQANLQGSRIAFDLVAPIAERKGAEGTELATEINKQFDALQAQLDSYGSLESGYVLYDTVTRDQQRALTDQIDALREPLSKLTNTVLGLG